MGPDRGQSPSALSAERPCFPRLNDITKGTEFGQRIAHPGQGPTVGDSFALSSDLYTDSTQTTKVGYAGVSCAWTSVTSTASEVECNVTVLLTSGPFGRGQISTTGLVNFASATRPATRSSRQWSGAPAVS